MDENTIYDFVYNKTSEKCAQNGVRMPYSKEVFDNWIGRDPVLINEQEFDIYLDDDGPENIKHYAMYRCMGKVVMGHVDDICSFLLNDMKSYKPRAMINAIATILNHSTPAKECGLMIDEKGRYSPTAGERTAVVHFLVHQRVATCKSVISWNLKKKVVEPIWDSFSNDTKNKIRVFFGREAKT